MIITEGYATALTAAQLAAGWVVAAISASNLPNVAQAVHPLAAGSYRHRRRQ